MGGVVGIGWMLLSAAPNQTRSDLPACGQGDVAESDLLQASGRCGATRRLCGAVPSTTRANALSCRTANAPAGSPKVWHPSTASPPPRTRLRRRVWLCVGRSAVVTGRTPAHRDALCVRRAPFLPLIPVRQLPRIRPSGSGRSGPRSDCRKSAGQGDGNGRGFGGGW